MTSSDPGKARSWQLPPLQQVEPEPPPDLAGMAESARAEGYAAGHAEGRAAGLAAAEAAAAELTALCRAMVMPFREQETVLLADLASLVSRVATAVVRRELETSPAVIEAVLAEALAVMGTVEGAISIRLHPRDYQRAREFLAGLQSGQQVELLEDASVSRGGCLLSAAASFLDASVERRLEDSLQALRDATDGSPAPGDAALRPEGGA